MENFEEKVIEVITFEDLEEVEDIVNGACAGSTGCCNSSTILLPAPRA